MKLTLGFSPCPNDTFIFDALVNRKIDTAGLTFEVVLEDVETLNQWALNGKLDITKLSFPALFKSLQHYTLLHSGSALGKGVGPLLVKPKELILENINQYLIALPGENTTANLLFSFAYPEAKNKKFIRFDEIEDYVLHTPNALGVIIHENRFTYQDKGLEKITDLGDIWEQEMKAPIPLGGIAINKKIAPKIALQVNSLIKKSLEYAFEHYPFISDYVKEYAQAMNENVMRQHIDLYVNNYSLQLGKDGEKAINVLLETYYKMNGVAADKKTALFI